MTNDQTKRIEWYPGPDDARAIEDRIKALCPLISEVTVLSESIYQGGTEIISNCRCGWSRSHLTVPPKDLRTVHKDDIAAYVSMSLQHCRPPLVGISCRNRPPNAEAHRNGTAQ
jgi:hypothetical protein